MGSHCDDTFPDVMLRGFSLDALMGTARSGGPHTQACSCGCVPNIMSLHEAARERARRREEANSKPTVAEVLQQQQLQLQARPPVPQPPQQQRQESQGQAQGQGQGQGQQQGQRQQQKQQQQQQQPPLLQMVATGLLAEECAPD